MRIPFAAIVLALLAIATPTHAQRTGWGMTTSSGDGLGHIAFPYMPSADWRRCTDEDRIHPLDRAVDSCNRLLTEHPSHLFKGAIYWERGMRYLDAGDRPRFDADLQLASAAFNEAVISDPRDHGGYTSRGFVLTRLERYDDALADFDHAIAIESNASSPHTGRGDILFRRGDYAGALASFDAASLIAARTGATMWRHHSARCEARAAARLEGARAFCDRGVRNADNPSHALTARGYYFFLQGDLNSAAADFTRAIAEDPYNAPAVHGRGVVAIREGRAAEGEADISRARQMDAFEVDYYANAGLQP